jgi:RHS repeat-associated protein
VVEFISCFWLLYNTYITLPAEDILAQDESYGDSTQLLYLRARYYNPADGRFVTRDTWRGNENIPISYNKWLYSYNQPINNSDPSGLSTSSSTYAVFEDDYNEKNKNAPHWSPQVMAVVNTTLSRIADRYANAYDQGMRKKYSAFCKVYNYPEKQYKIDPSRAFFAVHGGKITLTWVTYKSEYSAWGMGAWPRAIRIYEDAPLDRLSQISDNMDTSKLEHFITHEMGHVFENAYEEVLGNQPGRKLVGKTSNINNRNGLAEGWLNWQWSQDTSSGEIFADMFVGWAFNTWAQYPSNNDQRALEMYNAGVAKSDLMNTNMPGWIVNVITQRKR